MSLTMVTAGSWIGDAFIIAAVIGGTGSVHDDALFHVTGTPALNLWINCLIWGVVGILVKAVFYKLLISALFGRKVSEQLAAGNVALGTLLGGGFLALGSIVAGIVGG